MQSEVNSNAGTMVDQQYILTPEQHRMFLKFKERDEKQRIYARKVAVKNQIILEKAKTQGITATKDEIAARIAKEDAASGPKDA